MRVVILLFSVCLFAAGCSDIGKILKSSDYDMKLKRANQYYDAKKWDKAQLIYEDVMPIIKGSPEYEPAYYRWAYCHYNQRDYLNAENLFKSFFENFPNSSKAEEAEFMRAFCFYKQSPKPELDQTPTGKAIGLLQAYINTHPGSPRLKEAADMIDALRIKLEIKDFRSAELYYNMGFYKAAATAFRELLNAYPDSPQGDEYKLMVVKSWFKYAENSYEYRQAERFERVLNECADFVDRFPDSKLASDVSRYKSLSENNLKNIKNEQAKATTQR